MSEKKVNLIISLKDGVSSGLQGIRNGISATADAFKKIAVAGLGAATAVVVGLTRLVRKYAEVETVQNKLSATFQAMGESGKAAVAIWGEYASAIQKITTLDDEVVLGLVNTAKIMGVSNEKIAEATKGAIGLSKAFGLDLNTAMKLTVMAMAGNYDMLSRYIPALRTATNEGEKAAAVQNAMSVGWSIAKNEVNTLAVAFSQFKNAVSDAMETAGQAIFGDGGFTAAIQTAKDAIVKLTEGGAVSKWAEGIKSSIIAAGDAIQIIFKGGQGAKDVMGGIGAVIGAAFSDAVSGAINLLLKEGPTIGTAIADAFVSVAKGVFGGGPDKMTPEQKEKAQEDSLKGKSGLFAIGDRDIYEQKKSEFEAANKEARLSREGSSLVSKSGLGQSASEKALDDLQSILLREVSKGGIANVLQPKTQTDPYGGLPAWQYQQQFAAGMVSNAGGLTQAAISDQSGGGVKIVIDKTNELLTTQNAILQERLGGVE